MEESAAAAVDLEEGRVDTGMSKNASDMMGTQLPIEIYTITEAGVSLQATIAGTKFSVDEELNPTGK